MIRTRLIFGIIIAALAVWIIAGEQLSGVSADATVNARLLTLRAPIAGTVDEQDLSLGSLMQKGSIVAIVSDARQDSMRRDDLVSEAAAAEAEIARLQSLETAVISERDALSERVTSYRARRVASIEACLAHARTRLQLLTAQGGTADDLDLAPAVDDTSTRIPLEPTALPLAVNYA